MSKAVDIEYYYMNEGYSIQDMLDIINRRKPLGWVFSGLVHVGSTKMMFVRYE